LGRGTLSYNVAFYLVWVGVAWVGTASGSDEALRDGINERAAACEAYCLGCWDTCLPSSRGSQELMGDLLLRARLIDAHRGVDAHTNIEIG